METKQKEKKKENRFSFLYMGDPERGFHCQAYEDDRACCRTDIHIYR